MLYNIGGTKLQLQDFLGAARAYERYLTEGGGEVPRARRETVEPLLRSLEGRVGRIAVTVNRPDTEVFIDELKIGVSPIAGNTLIMAGNANDDLSALLKKVDVNPKDEEDARSRVKSLALTTDVLMFGGVAFATVGTVVWFLDRRARKQDKERAPSSKVSLDVGLGMLKVSGQF